MIIKFDKCMHKMHKDKNLKCAINLSYDNEHLISDYSRNILKKIHKAPDNLQEMFSDIANTFSVNCEHAQKIYNYISRGWLVPATPVMRYVNGHDSYPISCYVNKITHKKKDDLISQILSVYRQSLGGGGIGIDLSDIYEFTSKTEYLHNGAIAYIRAFEALFDIIKPYRERPTVFVYYISIDHPDIEELITLRKPTFDSAKVNISSRSHIGVIITDEFMRALENGSNWKLRSRQTGEVIREVSALDLWIKILITRSETGEPFIYFYDNAQRAKAEAYKVLGIDVPSTNMCTEIMLPSGYDHKQQLRSTVCCLSSINLEHIDEIKEDPEFFYNVYLYLDCIMEKYIQESAYVNDLKSARHCAIQSRPVGLGVMGFHYYLQKNSVPFDSQQAREINENIFSFIKKKSVEVNVAIGEAIGHAPDNIEAGLKGRFVTQTAIAPTAYISLVFHTSPGINPFFSNHFSHKTGIGRYPIKNKFLDRIIKERFPNNYSDVWEKISDKHGSIQSFSEFSEHEKAVFKTAFEIDQSAHIMMGADRQKYLDQTQSINLFFKLEASKKYISDLHRKAHSSGLPTLYYFFFSPAAMSDSGNTTSDHEVSEKVRDTSKLFSCYKCGN